MAGQLTSVYGVLIYTRTDFTLDSTTDLGLPGTNLTKFFDLQDRWTQEQPTLTPGKEEMTNLGIASR